MSLYVSKLTDSNNSPKWANDRINPNFLATFANRKLVEKGNCKPWCKLPWSPPLAQNIRRAQRDSLCLWGDIVERPDPKPWRKLPWSQPLAQNIRKAQRDSLFLWGGIVERPDPKGLSTFSQCTEFLAHRRFDLMSSRSGVRRSN